MTIRSIGLGIAALGMATAPIAAQASIADRTAPVGGEASELNGEGGLLIGILAALAVIGGIIIIADDDDDDPVSN